jgi:hypothetical protein
MGGIGWQRDWWKRSSGGSLGRPNVAIPEIKNKKLKIADFRGFPGFTARKSIQLGAFESSRAKSLYI